MKGFKKSVFIGCFIFFISFALQGQYNVLFVTAFTHEDSVLRDTLLTLSEFTFTEISGNTFLTMNLAQDFKTYDAVYISGYVGSQKCASYPIAGFPLPTVCHKAYALKMLEWNFVTGTLGYDWNITEKDSTYEEAEFMIIENNSHPIFKGLNYQNKDTIQWTTGKNDLDGEGEAHVAGFDLGVSPLNEIKNNSCLLARNLQLLNEQKVSSFLWAIEENTLTSRMFWADQQPTFQQYATKDFYTVAKNALLWVLHLEYRDFLIDLQIDNKSIQNFSPYNHVYHYQLCAYRDPGLVPEINAIAMDSVNLIITKVNNIYDTTFITAVRPDGMIKSNYKIIFDTIPCNEIDTICNGESTELYGVPEGKQHEYIYSWVSTPDGFTSSDSVITVNPAVSTTYKVTATHPLSKIVLRKEFLVNVKSSPEKPQLTKKGNNLLICPDSGMFRYNWYFEDVRFENEHKQFLVIPDNLPGNYYVEIDNGHACTRKSDPLLITFPNSALLDNSEKLSIYPVPSDGFLTLNLCDEYKGRVDVHIMDFTGKEIKQFAFIKESYYQIREIGLKDVPKGLYLINIVFNEYITSKVIMIN